MGALRARASPTATATPPTAARSTSATDAANCGACATACATPNGTPACVSGACAVAACDAGFADCDHLAGNGCEVSSATDTSHCGGCGTVCPARPSAIATCLASACGYACATGHRDCDGLATNGCEVDADADSANCGGCGVVCTQGRTCQSGACTTAVCAAGLADCDRDPANGCEVALDSSAANCGGCGTVCAYTNGTGACIAGSCSLATCASTYQNCNASSLDGCETNTASSVSSCGACGRACAAPNGTAACYSGACGVAACNAGYDNCDGSAANGCEVNLASSAANCGACGTVCSFPNASAVCSAGACALGSCNAGFANCDGIAANGCETNVFASPTSCGSCGRVCAAPTGGAAACASGVCGGSCPAGQTLLSNFVCVNTSTDANWCGASLAHCAAGQVCTAGVCVAQPLTACGGTSPSTLTDVNNCGACGTACAAGQICAVGHCTTPRRGQISNSDNTANLAVRADNGLMLGWGNNGMTVLGGGPTKTAGAYSTAQTAVSTLGAVSAVTTTGNPFFSCALRASDSQVRCWGNSSPTNCYFGPSNTGTASAPCADYNFNPVTVLTGPGGPALTAVSIAQGLNVTVALLADGTLRSWGNGYLGSGVNGSSGLSLATVSTSAGVPLTGVTAVSALFQHGCALRSDATVWCWGNNGAGEQGDGTFVARPYAAQVYLNASTPLTGVVEVSAGSNNTCVVRTDGTVWCWGGPYGTRARQIAGITRAVSVAPMSYSSGCALLNDGSVRCFGTNEFGDFGIPSGTGWSFGATNSFAMPGLTGAVAIGGGFNHRCVLMQDGTARCWGRNQTGQLGNGTSVDSVAPVTVWDFPTAGVR